MSKYASPLPRKILMRCWTTTLTAVAVGLFATQRAWALGIEAFLPKARRSSPLRKFRRNQELQRSHRPTRATTQKTASWLARPMKRFFGPNGRGCRLAPSKSLHGIRCRVGRFWFGARTAVRLSLMASNFNIS